MRYDIEFVRNQVADSCYCLFPRLGERTEEQIGGFRAACFSAARGFTRDFHVILGKLKNSCCRTIAMQDNGFHGKSSYDE